VDIEDVLLGNSEYSVRIAGLITFLLHYCIVMQAINLVREIFKHDKIWGTICISVPITPNSGGLARPPDPRDLHKTCHRNVPPWVLETLYCGVKR